VPAGAAAAAPRGNLDRRTESRLPTTKLSGQHDPGPSLGGVENTGWIDILTGIAAHKRKDGEYLVFVEEDYKAKVILYRWRP
jgi:hypothetical protein